MLKSIKNSDIIYQNGKIQTIKGISFGIERYIINIDIYACPEESKTCLSKKDKFLRNL